MSRRKTIVLCMAIILAAAIYVIRRSYYVFTVRRLANAVVKDIFTPGQHGSLWGSPSMQELVSLGPAAVPALMESLEEDPPWPADGAWFRDESFLRAAAMWVALGRIGPRYLIPRLIHAVEKDNQLGPLFVLSEYRNKAPEILHCLADTASRAADMIPPRHNGPISAEVWREEEKVYLGLQGLAMAVRDPRGRHIARSYLDCFSQHTNATVRSYALCAWSQVGDVNVLPALVRAKSDPDELVRKDADSELVALTGRPEDQSVEEWEKWYAENKHNIVAVPTGDWARPYEFVVREPAENKKD